MNKKTVTVSERLQPHAKDIKYLVLAKYHLPKVFFETVTVNDL